MTKGSCNLDSCFLCQSCIAEWKELIAVRKKTYGIKKGKQIFREGEKVEGIYFLYSGSVKVHKQWGDQKELILRFAKPGDVLGHRGLIDTEVYPIAATALGDSKVCFISSDFLETTIKTNPSFVYHLMHLYASELQNAERRMRNLAHMEVKGRIADALLEIISVFGLDKNNEIKIALSRQDIASYAGTTYETVFKFFIEQTAAGILSVNGKSIRINDQEQLKWLVTKQ